MTIRQKERFFFTHAITILSLFTYSVCDEKVKIMFYMLMILIKFSFFLQNFLAFFFQDEDQDSTMKFNRKNMLRITTKFGVVPHSFCQNQNAVPDPLTLLEDNSTKKLDTESLYTRVTPHQITALKTIQYIITVIPVQYIITCRGVDTKNSSF